MEESYGGCEVHCCVCGTVIAEGGDCDSVDTTSMCYRCETDSSKQPNPFTTSIERIVIGNVI